MNDMSAVIVPRSDQLNADSLLAGPITITISKVEIRPGTEQPVSIFYENDGGKPYKCCKSMARVLVHCWGPDASKYVGRSLTLYCDPEVKWGGLAVGGIRISHMSHISAQQVMALTVTKGNKRPFTVRPLVVEQPLTLAEWITTVLPSHLAGCKASADIEKVTASKQYVAALAKANDEQKAQMKGAVDAASARVSEAPAEGGGVGSDTEDAPLHAAEIVKEIGHCESEAAIKRSAAGFHSLMMEWKKDRPDLFALVDAAIVARRKVLNDPDGKLV